MPPWTQIDTVLLDLDGTLLDLSFDNHFWGALVPAAYAATRSLTPSQALAELVPKFRACEGSLSWYCVEHWSRELQLDIVRLKEDAAHGVAWLPGAETFLNVLRAAGKRVVLMTNAHPETLRIKAERTGVTRYFDAVFSSHRFGFPKERPEFWQAVRGAEAFDPQRSVFIDDSPAVLRAARDAGIRWVYGVRQPCFAREEPYRVVRDHGEYPAVDGVLELAPA